ncbi:MAG: GNAT family N-acetyltransferase, partial [Acetobacteraceae bacterium]|nr:GNAT family N-acetyltransferase [Acetobacteraceae bacterium]
PPDVTFAIEDAPARADAEALAWGLEAFNDTAWPGHQPWSTLGVFLRRDGKVTSGLAGELYAGWLFIRFFYLEEALRRQGIGRAIIAAAEARAAARGCHSAWVDTFSFQAPDFYRKQGYEEFGRLDYPPRGERIFLKKPLTPG